MVLLGVGSKVLFLFFSSVTLDEGFLEIVLELILLCAYTYPLCFVCLDML